MCIRVCKHALWRSLLWKMPGGKRGVGWGLLAYLVACHSPHMAWQVDVMGACKQTGRLLPSLVVPRCMAPCLLPTVWRCYCHCVCALVLFVLGCSSLRPRVLCDGGGWLERRVQPVLGVFCRACVWRRVELNSSLSLVSPCACSCIVLRVDAACLPVCACASRDACVGMHCHTHITTTSAGDVAAGLVITFAVRTAGGS